MHRARTAKIEGRTARVMLVDDHPLARMGMATFLNHEPDLCVALEAGDGPAALEMLEREQPDVVICDVGLPGMSGIQVIATIHERYPDLPVLAFSIHEEQFWAEPVLRAGALGYIMKGAEPETLAEAIRSVLGQRLFVSDSMARRLEVGSDRRTVTFSVDRLNRTDRDVLRMTAEGMALAEIAARLNVSPKAIEARREKLKKKLHCETTHELLRCALQWHTETDALM